MQRKIVSASILSLSLAAAVLLPMVTFAQNGPTTPDAGTGTGPTTPGTVTAPATTNTNTTGGATTLSNPLNATSLAGLVEEILTALEQVGYVLVVLALVYCGFLFVAAQGKEEKIREARSALMWTIIGGLVLVGATAIQAVIVSTANAL